MDAHSSSNGTRPSGSCPIQSQAAHDIASHPMRQSSTTMLTTAPAQSPNCCWDQLRVSLLWVLPAVLQELQYRLKGFSQCGHRPLSFTVAGTGVCWFITAFYLESLVLPPHHQLHLLQCTACAARPIQPRALMAAAHCNDIRRRLSALTWHRHDYPQQLA